MNKKIVKTVLIILLTILVIFGAGVVYHIVIPEYQAKKAAEEAAQLAKEKEAIRQEQLFDDYSRFYNEEYEGVFISMTESSGWSTNLFAGYIGVSVCKAEAVVESASEFSMLWQGVNGSGNVLSYCVFILDPYKLFEKPDVDEDASDTGEISIEQMGITYDSIIEDNPQTQFMVYMPMYPIKYWEDLTEEQFGNAMLRYHQVMEKLVSYDNVVLSCYTGYDWITKNSKIYDETGSINAKAAETLFLYSYRDYWVMDKDKLEDMMTLMNRKLWFADPVVEETHWWDAFKRREKPAPEPHMYEGYENYDVVFIGDSIFALSDGPFSIPSDFEVMTGARVYNLSKGGLPCAKYSDEAASMPELCEHFISGKQITEYEDYGVFNRDIDRFYQDDHTGRQLLIVTDFGTNDYFFGLPAQGETDYEYEGALRRSVEMLKENFPEAKFVSMTCYYISHCENGQKLNDQNLTIAPYKEVMTDISKEYGITCFNLEKLTDISEDTIGLYLDDGVHPSMAGTWEVSDTILENLTK